VKERDHLEDLGTDKRIILQEVLGRTNCLLPFDQVDHIKNNTSNNSSIVARVFVAAGMCI
jgi:hypothetical protein